MASLQGIVASEIGGLLGDESLVEYVAAMLRDSPNEAESGSSVAEFLSSSGASDEEASTSVAKVRVREHNFVVIMIS
jgi:hypothetical protein